MQPVLYVQPWRRLYRAVDRLAHRPQDSGRLHVTLSLSALRDALLLSAFLVGVAGLFLAALYTICERGKRLSR